MEFSSMALLGQRLLDSLPEPVVRKMQINLETNERSTFWQTQLTIKWPESRVFHIRATSKEEVECRIYEMLYKYLAGKNIIAAYHSSMLEDENEIIDNEAQEKRDFSLLLAARKRNSAASIIGGSNMFKKSIDSILSQECDSTLLRMMHDLSITTNGDKETEHKVSLQKTRNSKSNDTVNNIVDDSSTKRRKVELTEALGYPSLTVTCQNDVAPHQDAFLPTKIKQRTKVELTEGLSCPSPTITYQNGMAPHEDAFLSTKTEPKAKAELTETLPCPLPTITYQNGMAPHQDAFLSTKTKEELTETLPCPSPTITYQNGMAPHENAFLSTKTKVELIETLPCPLPTITYQNGMAPHQDAFLSTKTKVELTETLPCPSPTITYQNGMAPHENAFLSTKTKPKTKVELTETLPCPPPTITYQNDVTPFLTKAQRKRSKKRRAKEAAKNSEEELNPVLLEMARRNCCPTSIVNNFYQKLASQLGSEDGYFKIRYEDTGCLPLKWECIMQVKWPEQRAFSAIQQSKALAAVEVSLEIIGWLQSLGKITKTGDPILYNPAKMSVEPKDVQEPKQLLGGYTEGIRPQFNSGSKSIPGGNKMEIKMEPVSEVQQFDEGLRKVESCFPKPKYTIQQFYQSVASSFASEDYKLKVDYKMKSALPSMWQCSLQMKWPEPATFHAVKQSKSLAMNEAALLALQWLQSIGKITKQGFPIMISPKEVEKSTRVEVSLDPDTVQKAQRIIDIYTQSIEPLLRACDLSGYLSKDLQDQEPENELFACGEQRNPVTGRVLYKVSQETLNKRNDELYRRWQKHTSNNHSQGNLPIMEYRETILEMVENNQILVIKGQPGCGKSTLVPQFLLESFASKRQGAHCNIVVTQPRRIAAIAIAEWVARARGEMLGDVVGYQIRLQHVFPHHAGGSLLFCSTGILLRRLVNNPGLFGASHIIVDEAHERDISIDFLLTLLRRALKLNPDLKVIVMSATINAELFQNYFNGAAVVSVQGFTYPVKSIFMDEFAHNNIPVKCVVNQESPAVHVKAVADLIKWVHQNRERGGAILCFLPGWPEINKIQELLKNERELTVLSAHSKLSHTEQRRIFQPPIPGTRKVILSTNITETSITISDVEYVIDSGMHRENRLDVDEEMRTFGNHWISKASVHQRRGRAGRVKPGESFHLYTRKQFQNMEPFPVPEIMRAPLEKIVLDCKAYSKDEKVAEFLSQMPEAPTPQAIAFAVNELMQLGAVDTNENLTALGKRIALFSVHPKLSKALIHATILRCLNPIVTVASVFGNDIELFYGILTDKERIKNAKKAYHPTSDHLAVSWLYQDWETHSKESAQKAIAFCHPRKLLPDQMELVGKLRHLISQHLEDCAILEDQNSFADLEAECNMYAGIDELVKGVLLSAFGTLMISQDYDVRNGKLLKEKILVSDTGNRVSLGSESVNHKRTNFMSKFLTYFEQTRLTERKVVMVRETTMVTPLTVLLFFPGKFEITEIQPKNKNWDGYVLLEHDKRKVELLMKEQEAVLFLELRTVILNILYYFIVKEGVAEDSDRYKSISDFRQYLLRVLSDMLLKAGAAMEYKDGILVQ